MTRRASSATGAATATWMRPSDVTAMGQMACGLPLTRKAPMPWLSSSAMTTLASMSEAVSKTTTGVPASPWPFMPRPAAAAP